MPSTARLAITHTPNTFIPIPFLEMSLHTFDALSVSLPVTFIRYADCLYCLRNSEQTYFSFFFFVNPHKMYELCVVQAQCGISRTRCNNHVCFSFVLNAIFIVARNFGLCRKLNEVPNIW